MDEPWFDAQTDTSLLDDYVADTDSYRRIIADVIITDDEIAEHGQRAKSLLHQLEDSLSPEIRAVVAEALRPLPVT